MVAAPVPDHHRHPRDVEAGHLQKNLAAADLALPANALAELDVLTPGTN